MGLKCCNLHHDKKLALEGMQKVGGPTFKFQEVVEFNCDGEPIGPATRGQLSTLVHMPAA
jgi:hypothetical protein